MNRRFREALAYLKLAGRSLIHGPSNVDDAPLLVARIREIFEAAERDESPVTTGDSSIAGPLPAEPLQESNAFGSAFTNELRSYLRLSGFANAVAMELGIPWSRVNAVLMGNKQSPQIEEALRREIRRVAENLQAIGGAA